jgi:hypothetical protein
MPNYLLKPRCPIWLPGAAPPGTRLYMPLSEGAGTTVHDVSRRSKDGTFVGAPAWQSSRYGTRLGGFTASDYVAIDPATQILGVTYPFWLAALFVNTSTSFGIFAMQGYSLDSTPQVAIRLNPGGTNTLDYNVLDDAAAHPNPFASGRTEATDGQPHVIMGVSRTASDHKLYLDGLQIATSSTAISTMTSDRLSLGVNRSTSVNFPFPGEFGAFACGVGAVPDTVAFAQDWLTGRFRAVRSQAARTTVLFRAANPLYEATYAATLASASFSGSATVVPPPSTAAFAATTTATFAATATAVPHPAAATFTATTTATFAAHVRTVAAPTTSEIQYRDPTGTTGLLVYAQRRTPTGRVWNGSSHVTFSAAGWTTYEIPLADVGGGFYYANMPAAAAGAYTFAIFEQAGVVPAAGDLTLGVTPYPMQWDGSAEISLNNVSAAGLPDPAPAGYGDAPPTGTTAVTHNTGGTNALTVQDSDSQPIFGAVVSAYLASAYASSPATAPVITDTTTDINGHWTLHLPSGATYTLVFVSPGDQSGTSNVTV